MYNGEFMPEISPTEASGDGRLVGGGYEDPGVVEYLVPRAPLVLRA